MNEVDEETMELSVWESLTYSSRTEHSLMENKQDAVL